MATSFPGALDSYSTKVDNVDSVLAAHVNDPQDAIETLQVKIGVTSSSVATSIDYFLKNASGAYRLHSHSGNSSDGSSAIGPLTDVELANDIDLGSFQVRMKQLYADVATGTAPLVIISTTVVPNLNADQVDGLDSTDIVQIAGTQTITGDKTFSGNTTLADGSQMDSSAAPTADSDIANKKYIDDQISAVPSILSGSYDSGWFAWSDNTTYTKTHDLGTTKVMFQLWYSANSAGTSNVTAFLCGLAGGYNTNTGPTIHTLTTTSIKIFMTSYNNIRLADNSAPSSGYAKLVMIALA